MARGPKNWENPGHHHILCGCIRPVKRIQRNKFEYFCLWGLVWDIPKLMNKTSTQFLGYQNFMNKSLPQLTGTPLGYTQTHSSDDSQTTFQFDYFFNWRSFGVKNHGFQNSEIHKAREQFSVQIFLHPKKPCFLGIRGDTTPASPWFLHGIFGGQVQTGSICRCIFRELFASQITTCTGSSTKKNNDTPWNLRCS